MNTMSKPLHRDVFSWPSQAWLNRDRYDVIKAGSFEAEDLGLELTDLNLSTMVRQLINQAKIEDKDESFSLFDMGNTISKYNTWKECFPRIRPFFDVTYHDDPCVITLLDQLGADFYCASKGEIDLVVNKLKISSSKVIYAKTVKSNSHLTHAKSLGVDLMTFDNEEELYKIKQYYPNARLVLRLSPDLSGNEDKTFKDKFGCDIKNVPKLCALTKDLGLNLVGISFNVGTGCKESDLYTKVIRAARQVFDLAKDIGFDLHILDIGGGFHGDEDAEENIKKMSVSINEVLDDLFPATSGVMIMAEPGRYFVESSLMLATCVIAKRIKETPQGSVFEYYISESIYGMFRDDILCRPKTATAIRNRQTNSATHKSTVWGQTCDPRDKILSGCALPQLDVGDWLIFNGKGTYSVSLHCNFNGFYLQPIGRMMAREVWGTLFQA